MVKTPPDENSPKLKIFALQLPAKPKNGPFLEPKNTKKPLLWHFCFKNAKKRNFWSFLVIFGAKTTKAKPMTIFDGHQKRPKFRKAKFLAPKMSKNAYFDPFLVQKWPKQVIFGLKYPKNGHFWLFLIPKMALNSPKMRPEGPRWSMRVQPQRKQPHWSERAMRASVIPRVP